MITNCNLHRGCVVVHDNLQRCPMCKLEKENIRIAQDNAYTDILMDVQTKAKVIENQIGEIIESIETNLESLKETE